MKREVKSRGDAEVKEHKDNARKATFDRPAAEKRGDTAPAVPMMATGTQNLEGIGKKDRCTAHEGARGARARSARARTRSERANEAVWGNQDEP